MANELYQLMMADQAPIFDDRRRQELAAQEAAARQPPGWLQTYRNLAVAPLLPLPLMQQPAAMGSEVEKLKRLGQESWRAV